MTERFDLTLSGSGAALAATQLHRSKLHVLGTRDTVGAGATDAVGLTDSISTLEIPPSGLILIDGCEDFAMFTTTSITVVAGRTANAFAVTDVNGQFGLASGIPTARQTDEITVGFALKVAAHPPSTCALVRVQTTGGAAVQDTLALGADGRLFHRRGAFPGGSSLGFTTANAVPANTWTYVEWSVKLSNTVGYARIKVNGTPRLALTEIDTRQSGTTEPFDGVLFGVPSIESSGGLFPILFDDIYIRNDLNVHGPCTVETLYPNGNGAASQWLGSDGNSTDNYLLIDEVGNPNTADYVASSTVGQRDLVTLTDLAATGKAVVGVCHQVSVAKTDAGAANFKIVNRRSSDVKSTTTTPTTSTLGYAYCLELDPETGLPFTAANVNALQTGIERV